MDSAYENRMAPPAGTDWVGAPPPPTMRHVPAHPDSTQRPGHNPAPGEPPPAGGTPLAIDLSLEDLEREARHAIGEMAYAYYAGGADDERLLAGNVEAWSHWQLPPEGAAGG